MNSKGRDRMRHAHPHHHRGREVHGGHPRGHGEHFELGRPAGPQTFRRGRALQFLEFLNVRRSTLLRQLDQPEFADLRPTLLGELKAVESVRDEFVAMFDLWPDVDGGQEVAEDGTTEPGKGSAGSGDRWRGATGHASERASSSDADSGGEAKEDGA